MGKMYEKYKHRLIFMDYKDARWTTPAADLTLSKLVITPTTSSHTGSIDISYMLANAGNADASADHVGLFLSTDSKITTSDTLLFDYNDGHSYTPLAHGAMSALDPASAMPLAPGVGLR